MQSTDRVFRKHTVAVECKQMEGWWHESSSGRVQCGGTKPWQQVEGCKSCSIMGRRLGTGQMGSTVRKRARRASRFTEEQLGGWRGSLTTEGTDPGEGEFETEDLYMKVTCETSKGCSSHMIMMTFRSEMKMASCMRVKSPSHV